MTDVDRPSSRPAQRRRPLLAEPDFLRLWMAGAFAATARWLEMLSVAIFVFEVTGSVPLVAAMLMLRMLPLGLFGVFGARSPVGSTARSCCWRCWRDPRSYPRRRMGRRA